MGLVTFSAPEVHATATHTDPDNRADGMLNMASYGAIPLELNSYCSVVMARRVVPPGQGVMGLTRPLPMLARKTRASLAEVEDKYPPSEWRSTATDCRQ